MSGSVCHRDPMKSSDDAFLICWVLAVNDYGVSPCVRTPVHILPSPDTLLGLPSPTHTVSSDNLLFAIRISPYSGSLRPHLVYRSRPMC